MKNPNVRTVYDIESKSKRAKRWGAWDYRFRTPKEAIVHAERMNDEYPECEYRAISVTITTTVERKVIE